MSGREGRRGRTRRGVLGVSISLLGGALAVGRAVPLGDDADGTNAAGSEGPAEGLFELAFGIGPDAFAVVVLGEEEHGDAIPSRRNIGLAYYSHQRFVQGSSGRFVVACEGMEPVGIGSDGLNVTVLPRNGLCWGDVRGRGDLEFAFSTGA